nr:ribonuclease H-like domain-containing protein [Tanacetum cinerariifolium]
MHMGLWYPKDTGFELTAFSDSDHAGCLDSLKSTSGGIQFLGGDKLVSWSSKKQDCTLISSAKAEYVSLSANKNKQKIESKKGNMISDAMNGSAEFDGENDTGNNNEIMENGGIKSMDGVGTEKNVKENQDEKSCDSHEVLNENSKECLDAEIDKTDCERNRIVGISERNGVVMI